MTPATTKETMRINQYIQLMETALEKKRRVMGVGAPGVGKTFGAMAAAQHQGFDFIGLCSPLEDPSTIRGYPSRGTNGEATHCLFDGVAKAFKADKPTLLFFDDLGMASESTMRAIIRLVQFGEIDGRKLPDCVLIGAATNDVGHGAGVYGMIEPLKSRFHSIVTVEANLEDTIIYGLANGWPSDMLAYLRNDPGALHDWKPAKNMQPDGACPRSWEYAAGWVNDGVEDNEILAGCVGKAQATKYLAFRQLVNELPDVDAVILNPETAAVPENPSARYLVSMALASKMTAGNFSQILTYAQRLPQMFRAFCIRDAMVAEEYRKKNKTLPKDWKPIAHAREFAGWVCSQDGKEIISAGTSL